MDPIKELIASLTNLELGRGMTVEEKDEDITKQLAKHYLPLLQALYVEYQSVSFDPADFSVVYLDGVRYTLPKGQPDLDVHLAEITTILSQLCEDGESAEEILGTVKQILNSK